MACITAGQIQLSELPLPTLKWFLRLWFFSSPTFKLCWGICWAPKVPEWAHTNLAPTPEHPWPGPQVRWGIANSTQLQAHSSGRFYAILEQLLQHNVTTAHQQRLPSTPTMLFLCSVLSWLTTSTRSGLIPLQILCIFCLQIFPLCSSCPFLASPSNPTLAPGPLLPTLCLKCPSPSPRPFLPLTILRRISGGPMSHLLLFQGMLSSSS